MAPLAGPSTSSPIHDYTEGASVMDLEEVLANNRLSRRNSQHSTFGDDNNNNAMFSGPGHVVNPSSVSRMSHFEPGRRSSEAQSLHRRRSRDSGLTSYSSAHQRRDSWGNEHSRQTNGGENGELYEEDLEDTTSAVGRKSLRRRESLSPPPRHTMFDNLAHLFRRGERVEQSGHISRSTSRHSRYRRRRDSVSECAVESEGEERWGYSSGEELSGEEEEEGPLNSDDISLSQSMKGDSERGSPALPTQTLPLLSMDPVFGGEVRLEVDHPFSLLGPPPKGPPSRQIIHIVDEDVSVRFVGYETVLWRDYLWKLGCLLTFGALGLVGHWFPRTWLLWVASERPFINIKNGFIVVESAYRDISLFPLHCLSYKHHISSIFASSVPQVDLLPLEDRTSHDYDFATGILSNLIVVDYRYSRFAVDPRTGLFNFVRNWRDPNWTSLAAVVRGLSSSSRQRRQQIFGRNEVAIEGKSTFSLLVDEVIHPFYVFQIASIILWSIDDYYYYAFCIALISIISITTTLLDTQKTIARLRDISHFSCRVEILIDGQWTERDSSDLIPGDIVNLTSLPLSLVPADFFILSGDAIINESMLTGESVPVSKVPAKDEDLVRWKELKDENPKSFLYAGTRAVRIRGSFAEDNVRGKPALAVVARTGFDTTKGALVRSMLFPKPLGFKFYRDSMRFIAVLAGIAGAGFCISTVQFIRMGLKWETILVRALDLITVVVPPALPATLSIGTSFALSRLRRGGIFCISPSRVNVGGKINVCCFDKTGTLTEDGLDILGIRGLERAGTRFAELMEDIRDLPLVAGHATFLHALATCHSLKLVDGQVIGDPLDVKMFEFTQWTLEEGQVGGVGVIKTKTGEILERTALVQTVVRPPGSSGFRLEDALKGAAKHTHFLELGVIRTFEFVSSLRRMSVIVKRLKGSSMEIYAKGAPEVMGDICDKDTFPEDYSDLLSYYTKRGYRVIAVAGKSIEGLSWLKAQRMKREDAESGLRFLGFVIFENRLKPGTRPAIQFLRAAYLPCRMITGDNPLTAVSVARECNIINQGSHVFSPKFIYGNATLPNAQLEWSCVDDEAWKLNSHALKPDTPPTHNLESEERESQDYSLVITGDVFRWMLNYAPMDTLQRMLVKTQIFSRMSPDEKNEVVERLQSFGYTVLMCGDGANDCSALKAADVGISLSEAEASVAAPFTSATPDIGCVLEVIKEGRASLVTSFSCFKYMALYSLIQFTSVTLLYSFASSLGDFQFLYIDLFIIIPIAVTMGRTLPYPRVHTKRPTASLVSRKVLMSIIGQIIVNAMTQVWAYVWVREQEWYVPPPKSNPSQDGNKLESKNMENTVLFLVSCFQYVLVAAIFSIGPPYRKPMWTNGWLMAVIGILTGVNLLVLLAPPRWVVDVLTLVEIPQQGRYVLLSGVVINGMASVMFESWCTRWLDKGIRKWMEIWNVHGKTRKKGYQLIDGEE